MTNNREDLLEGTVYLPEQFRELVPNGNMSVMEDMFESIFQDFLLGKRTSSFYWLEKFTDTVTFNQFLYHLSQAGWVISAMKGNWCTLAFNRSKLLKWLSEIEIDYMIYSHKYAKYTMEVLPSENTHITKTPLGLRDVGLKREGFRMSGNYRFKYDVDMLEKYQAEITHNLIKDLIDMDLDGISYIDMASTLIQGYIELDEEMTVGDSLSDSRGRAIHKCTTKVFNPIASKDARALIKLPEEPLLDCDVVYAFISELLGYKSTSAEEAAAQGALSCTSREFNKVTKKNRHKVLYKNIWLERLYDNLDCYDGTNWSVPTDCDATASLLQIIGVLLGDEEAMTKTNAIGDGYEDIWSIKGLTREHAKKAVTPIVFGSSSTPEKLWRKNGLNYTDKQLDIINYELTEGRFKKAKDFADFILSNVKPKKEQDVRIFRNTFKVYCNKSKVTGSVAIKERVYNTETSTTKMVSYREDTTIPDLKAFKRYFVTLLIHNLDSILLDKTLLTLGGNAIGVHDALILHPNKVKDAKASYRDAMQVISDNRESVLEEYFHSIGITADFSHLLGEAGEVEISTNLLK